MQRILVIQDVGLWIDLNRHLSGVASVDLFEALSFETGQILAQIERPKVVVYGTDCDGPGPEEFHRQLRASGFGEIQVVAVDPQATGRPRGDGPIFCRADELQDVITSLLDPSAPAEAEEAELLAHYEVAEDGAEASSSGFAVVLELKEDALVFESDKPLSKGAKVSLNFFLPDPTSDAQRTRVAVDCKIVECRDDAGLLFVAHVTRIASDSRKVLTRYIDAGASRSTLP